MSLALLHSIIRDDYVVKIISNQIYKLVRIMKKAKALWGFSTHHNSLCKSRGGSEPNSKKTNFPLIKIALINVEAQQQPHLVKVEDQPYVVPSQQHPSTPIIMT